MDRTTTSKQETGSGNLENLNRRPVNVTVTRIYSERSRSTDINNNQGRILVHPKNPVSIVVSSMSEPGPFDIPVVSLCFSVIQVALYLLQDMIGITSEESVYVSWKTVITEGDFWRLLYAHFFHFGRVHIFFNVITLMCLGRYLEKKIKKIPFAILIIVMAVVSNLLYIFMSDILCSGPFNEYTVGFSTVMFSLRMVHIFTLDSEANNGRGDPNLIFGFIPVKLPPTISPWQPVLETIFFDLVVIGRCIAATLSGMCAALPFPLLMKHYKEYIMIPRNPPPPPPKFRVRGDTGSSQTNNDSDNNNDAGKADANDNHDHND